jgi:hypothetical protein
MVILREETVLLSQKLIDNKKCDILLKKIHKEIKL